MYARTYGMVPMQTGYRCPHTCGKTASLVNGHKLTLASLIELIKNWKSGQWWQITSSIIDWADQTCHFHHVIVQPPQRNNIWSYSNTYWLNKPTSHMWQSWKSGQWQQNDSYLSESTVETSYSHHNSLNICYGTNSPRLQSLYLTCGKIVSLVNSHILTLTSLIKLIKHVAFIR